MIDSVLRFVYAYKKQDWASPDAWIGVDLDGTWARNDLSWCGPPGFEVGPPIEEMTDLVRTLLTVPIKVKLFTARATEPRGYEQARHFLMKLGLEKQIDITASKDYNMILSLDDRAWTVAQNKGTSPQCMRCGEYLDYVSREIP